MNSRQLNVFLVVAEIGNFTRAARELNIVQPAVSNTIRKMEEGLGLPLFVRKDRAVALTTEGEVLLKNARIILHQFRKAELEMVELRELERGQVRFGVPDSLGIYYFPKIIAAFKSRYPNLHFSVQALGLFKMQQMIEEDQLDMGTVITSDMSKKLDGKRFFTGEIVACASKDHPFAQREVVTIREFASEPLVGFHKGSHKRRMIESICREENINPNFAFETSLIPLIKELIRKGFGVSSFLRPVVEGDDRIKMIPFEPPINVSYSMAWKKGNVLSMANQAFVDFLLESERKPVVSG